MDEIKKDAEVYHALRGELERQENTLCMIPSENYPSKAVLSALGSILTSKYSEGYPGRRYYSGNKFIDEIETLAIERAKKLFNAEHANVQPLSGAIANHAVYSALLQPGDKILAMSLPSGGHLTHGSKANFSGQRYDFIYYDVNQETGLIDMNEIREIAIREKPKMIISGYSAYPRKIDFKEFHKIAEEIGAYSFADISHIAGLIAGNAHQSPFPFTDVVMSTTHKTLRGPRGAIILCKKKFAEKIDAAVFPGMQSGPHNNSIAAKAVCFNEASKPEFKEYASQIIKNAKILAETLQNNELKLVSGGTDNHLILIDLSEIGISGKQIAEALEEAGIIVNANMIPFDKKSPINPSGIRIGTPALTTRGMKEIEMKQIGEWTAKVINDSNNSELKSKIKQEVEELCGKFPIYDSC